LDCSLSDPNSHLIFVAAKNREVRKDQVHAELSCGRSRPSAIFRENLLASPEYVQSLMSPPSSELNVVETPFSDREREQLRLMCHYTLHASHSLAEITIPQDRDQSLWSTWVTELALESDFLLHGVLSLSALHLALSGVSRQKNIILAIRHHDLGVALFRPHLSTITAGHYDAMIAFSCIVAFYAFGIQRLSEPDESPIIKLYQVLTLIRGSSVILKADYEAVLRSRWSAMMTHIPDEVPQELPDDIKDMLSTLQQCASTTTLGIDQQNVYRSTIEVLRANLEYALTHLFTQKTTTLFVVMCPAEFWNLISSGEPLALAILANYAVILHWQQKNIWMEGWGKDLAEAVTSAISSEWHDCIHWARRETGCV
jgi:hypothetical protein